MHRMASLLHHAAEERESNMSEILQLEPLPTKPMMQSDRRKGKWSIEEERYTASMIRYFVQGALHVPTGTTLRSFVAEELYCDPMRVSKKLAHSVCAGLKIPKKIGKRVYYPDSSSPDSVENRHKAHARLAELRLAFIAKLKIEEGQERANQLASRLSIANIVSTGHMDSIYDVYNQQKYTGMCSPDDLTVLSSTARISEDEETSSEDPQSPLSPTHLEGTPNHLPPLKKRRINML